MYFLGWFKAIDTCAYCNFISVVGGEMVQEHSGMYVLSEESFYVETGVICVEL